ncbi:MAG: transposase, partial [Actinobacteria bacterium]|nr:transposase [Actinomycetota bacterium]
YILDGLLDPQTSVRPREIVTDTAGYTDVIFGLFRILGYQYSPRLADAGAATFWRLNPTDYGPLKSLARHQVNRALVEQHYDDLLRVAGSLLQRHIVNAIVLYNTIYTQRALDHLAGQGLAIDDADVERLSPLATDHITLTGRYRIVLPEQLRDRGAYRELNTPALAA